MGDQHHPINRAQRLHLHTVDPLRLIASVQRVDEPPTMGWKSVGRAVHVRHEQQQQQQRCRTL
jgi:hypothetical protein